MFPDAYKIRSPYLADLFMNHEFVIGKQGESDVVFFAKEVHFKSPQDNAASRHPGVPVAQARSKVLLLWGAARQKQR